MTRIAFLDTETTSLRHDRRPWEIAVIIRENDAQVAAESWFISTEDLDLGNADPSSLAIGRFHQRHPQSFKDSYLSSDVVTDWQAARAIATLTLGATVVAANVGFDIETIAAMMRRANHCPSWHHRPLDIEAFAAGVLGWPIARSLSDTAAALGVEVDKEQRHTAMGDARTVAAVYDAAIARRAAA